MDRLKNARNGILMGILNNIFNYVLPFISRTIIIYKLGNEYLGLSTLFTSILQMLSLSELGFGTAISYMLYKPMAEHNVTKINALLKLYRFIYRIIGLTIVALSIVLLPFLDNLIAGTYPQTINIYILYFIYVGNTVVSYFLFAYKRVILSATQRYDIEVNIATIVVILQSLLQIILLLLFANYYMYVIVIPVMTILSNILCELVISRKYPEFKCEGKIDKGEIYTILKNTGGAFCSKIGSIIYLSADNIVISAFLGLTILGKYSNYYYVIGALISIFATVHNTIRPILGNYLVVESVEKNWELFNNIFFGYMWIVILCCNCCIVLFQPFEYLWGGEKNLLEFSIVILLVIYFYSGRIYAIMSVYQESAGIMWQGKFIPLISAFVNLILNVFLVQIIGLAGVLISSIVSSILVNFPGNLYIIFNYIFKDNDKKINFMKTVFWLTVQAIICIGINFYACSFFSETSWSGLFIRLGVTLVLTNMFLIVINLRNNYFKNTILLCKKVILKK